MHLPQTVWIGTDAASFWIHHPDDLAHRRDDQFGWWADPAAEFAAGRMVGWGTGSDGGWALRLTDRPGELPLVPDRRREYLLVVRHGRVLIDSDRYLPSDLGDADDEPDESQWLTVPDGRYRVSVGLVDSHPGDGLPDYEVLFAVIDESVGIAVPDGLPELRPTEATLGRVVSAWTARPDDVPMSAYERWLISQDSGDPTVVLADAPDDGGPVPPSGPLPRTSPPPVVESAPAEIALLIAAAAENGHLPVARIDVALAGRLLTHAGLAGWLRLHLPSTDDERAGLAELSRAERYRTSVSRLRALAELPTRPDPVGLGPEEARLLRAVPALTAVELPDGPMLAFRDPNGATLPGATVHVTVPAQYAAAAAGAPYVALVAPSLVAEARFPIHPAVIARSAGWDPAASILSVEAVALGRWNGDVPDAEPGPVRPTGSPARPSPDADVQTLVGLIESAARHGRWPVGATPELPDPMVATGFRTVDGIVEWLVRALPMTPARRLDIYWCSDRAAAGGELLAQLRALADPDEVPADEADLLAETSFPVDLPAGPLHLATGVLPRPGQVEELTGRGHPPRHELFSPDGYDGDLATIAETTTVEAPGGLVHRRRHLGVVRVTRGHLERRGLMAQFAPEPAPPEQDVDDIVTPAAVAAFAAEHLAGLGPWIWALDRLHSAAAVSACLLRRLPVPPDRRKVALTLYATPPRERLHLLLDRMEELAGPGRRIERSRMPDGYPAFRALLESQPARPRSIVPFERMPVVTDDDGNFLVGDRIDLRPGPQRWNEFASRDFAVYAGTYRAGRPGLLMRASAANQDAGVMTYEAVRLVRLREVGPAAGVSFGADLQDATPPAEAALDGVVDRRDLRDLLVRAAERHPDVARGWRRPPMPPVVDIVDRPWPAISDDLLRRLPMPLDARLELATAPGRDRLAALVAQLRDIADDLPPPVQREFERPRLLPGLPPAPVPVLAMDFVLAPTATTIKLSPTMRGLALTAGWLVVTHEPAVGRAALLIRPHPGPGTPYQNGWIDVPIDQLRPVVIRGTRPGPEGRTYADLAAAPSAWDAIGWRRVAAEGDHDRLTALVDRLVAAYGRHNGLLGGGAHRFHLLWQAGRFTSLPALHGWLIRTLPLTWRGRLELPALLAADRHRVLIELLDAVSAGRAIDQAVAAAEETGSASFARTQAFRT